MPDENDQTPQPEENKGTPPVTDETYQKNFQEFFQKISRKGKNKQTPRNLVKT